tara:strand:- start:456 stop:2345 length:1890 start_codon:yes stop_codon:yes gene_type:complete
MKNVRRSDIDTLRAISVISVIIFHLDQSFFPNGYLGVDIFFVISGYVITKSILNAINSKSFKFVEFYYRRLKRIFPVLLVVLFASFLAAAIIFLVSDFKRFLESLIASIGFVSNFYFWITGGYFSTNDQLKPLLHLWSLSVEEQFYLFFPVFLYLLYKIEKTKLFYLLIIFIIILLSFIINLYFISKGHRDIIFFMFPARIWQFGLGVFFAIVPLINIKNTGISYLYFFTATLLIIFNFVRKIDFLPDATLMCLGVSLILYRAYDKKIFVKFLFNFKPIIFIGLISYSLYLWHWPIISFLKYIYVEGLPLKVIFFSLFIIFSLSCVTWKFVEQPFLYRYSKKTTLLFIIISFLILILSSFLILQVKNLPSRYSNFPNNLAKSIGSTYNCSLKEYIKYGDTYACLLNKKNKLQFKDVLFGNSHAYMYGWAYKNYLKNSNKKGLIIQLSNCLPFIDINISKKCMNKTSAYYKDILNDESIKNVVIGLTWYSDKLIDKKGNTFKDENFERKKNAIKLLIQDFNSKNKNVYLLGPVFIPGKEFAPEILAREIIFKDKKEFEFKKPRKLFDKEYGELISYFQNLLGKNFLLPHKILCDDDYCHFGDEKGSFFSDTNHLSKYGSMKMLSLFDKIE